MTQSTTWQGDQRLGGLRRFAIAITVLNVLGHTVLGFEQAPIVPFVAMLAACTTELLLESLDAALHSRRPRFLGGGWVKLVDFLLPAHISGLATGMLLYTNDRLGVVVCAAVLAIAFKSLFRVSVDGRDCHVFNPSNVGITAVLLAFPWVGIAPPYHFTENLSTIGDWALPGLIVVTGTIVNLRFARRLPLVVAWLSGFFVLSLARHLSTAPIVEVRHWLPVSSTSLPFLMSFHWNSPAVAVGPWEVIAPALTPMTGVAFILYTFYMVTDPATTPAAPRQQVAFGFAVAAVYAVLMAFHVVYGLFFALSIVSAARGISLAVAERVRRHREDVAPELVTVAIER